MGYTVAAPNKGYPAEHRSLSVTMLALALLSDLYLAWATNVEGWSYFEKALHLQLGPLFVGAWLSIWLSWQLMIGLTFARGERKPVVL